ncbi:MAG: transporter [Rhodobacterales bacterium]|nr:MAG: transporter [Rhodobacterales bacterium]
MAGVLMVAQPVVAKAESLADAMVSAYRHSGLLEQNRALLRAADEDVATAVGALRPVLAWSASYSRGRGRTFNSRTMLSSARSTRSEINIQVFAELLLYDGGQSRMRIDAAKEVVLATRQGLRGVEQQILLRAVAAFYDVRRQTEFVRLGKNNVRVIGQELRAARDRFEVGEVTRTDVSLAEARLAGARAALAASEGLLSQAREEYRAATGHYPGKLSNPPKPPSIAKSEKSAKAIAVQAHPDMIRTRHTVTAAEIAIAIAEAAMSPTVTMSAGISNTQDFETRDFTNGASVGVNLSGPIYSGGRLSSAVRKARHQRDAERAGLHTVRHAVYQGVGNAWSQWEMARASRAASEGQVRASRVAFEGVREEAKLGARTTLDVLDAEQELLDARANLISAGIDEQVARYNVLASMGWLTAERLKLRVPHYDPAEYYNMVKDAPHILSDRGQKLDKVLRSLGKE